MWLQMALFPFFIAEYYYFVYIYIPHLLYSSMCGDLGCFHILGIVNSAAMNISLHIFKIYVLIERKLLHIVVLVSGIQQREPAITIQRVPASRASLLSPVPPL